MEPKWAEENLQTIRTLMERSAVYRLALAPIMLYAGALGVLPTLAGLLFHLDSMRAFSALWLGTAALAVGGAFLIARRQALKDKETFLVAADPAGGQPCRRRWRRACVWACCSCRGVANATSSRRFSGFCFTAARSIPPDSSCRGESNCSAGSSSDRFLRALFYVFALGWIKSEPNAHWLMGFFFGVLHLAYGAYLYLTEKGKICGVNPEPFLQLDRVIHEKGRLAIMSMLAATPELSFTELRDALGNDRRQSDHAYPRACSRKAMSPWPSPIRTTARSRPAR